MDENITTTEQLQYVVSLHYTGTVFAQAKSLTWVCTIRHNQHSYRGQVGVFLVLVGHHGPVEITALHQGHTCYEGTWKTCYMLLLKIILPFTYTFS